METIGCELNRIQRSTPSRVATVAAAVLTTEPALVANILQFLPLTSKEAPKAVKKDQPNRRDQEDDDDYEDDEDEEDDDEDEMVEWREWRERRSIPTPSELALETIAALCRAIPGLSNLVGPTNKGFWRDMVLAHFDFSKNSITNSFNVDEMLVESLSKWDAMNAYYRPSQYEFLTEIQRDRSKLATLWPEHEDAFSLFFDLTVLQRITGPWIQGFKTHTDGDEDLMSCLLSRLDRDISEKGFELFEHCGYQQQYWGTGNVPWYSVDVDRRIVSKRWTGFERPPPSIPDDYGRYETDIEEYPTDEEMDSFPYTSDDIDFLVFRQLVYESFTDFRRLFPCPDECPGPDFYIGKSKRSGRWHGFVGHSYF